MVNLNVDALLVNSSWKNGIYMLGNRILAKQSTVVRGQVEMFSRPRIEQLLFDASTAGAGEIKIFESLYMLMLFTF
jgi:hypothetical protein